MHDCRSVRVTPHHLSARRTSHSALTALLALCLCLAAGLLALALAAPAAQAAPATGDISGTVTDAGHTGLANIDVQAYQADTSGGWDWITDVTTATDGTFDLGGLAPGAYRVEFRDYSGTYLTQCYDNKATLDSAADVTVGAGSVTANIDATLALAGDIKGTVTDAADTGLAGIDVTAYDADGNYVNDVNTASDGTYDLNGLGTGDYRLQFEDYSGTYLTQYYNGEPSLDAADAVAVTAGSTTSPIDATLDLSGQITGTVTNAGDTDLANIEVTAYDAGGNEVADVNTASDGSYDVNGLVTGDYRLQFQDGSGTYLTQYFDNEPSLDAADTVAVTAGSTTSGVDAQLALAGHITGKLTDAGLAGLANVDVEAYQSDGSGGWNEVDDVSTAGNGTYDLGGLATGSYRLEFRDYTGTYLTQYYDKAANLDVATDVTVSAGSTTANINATLALAGYITGSIKNANSHGLGSIDVTAYRSDGAGGWTYVTDVNTTNGGSYDLGALAAGTYRLGFPDYSQTYATEYYNNAPSLVSASDIVVTGGVTTNINATLPLAGQISGTVTDASHNGLGSIYVTVWQSDGAGGWNELEGTGTAADGTYDLTGLATDRYRLEFEDYSGSGYATQYYDNAPSMSAGDGVAVTAGKTTANVDATLAIPGSDTTAPTTFASGVDALWHRSAVKVTLNASDEVGGSGLWLTQYRLQGASGWSFYTGPFTISAQGASTYQYRSIDVAQNAELAKSFTVKIDGKAPAATVKALSVKAANARKGKIIKVAVTIGDPKPSCGSATLVLVLTTTANKKLATLTFKGEPTNKALTLSDKLTRTLAKGSYYLTVRATDAAGNVQAKVAKAKLTVK